MSTTEHPSQTTEETPSSAKLRKARIIRSKLKGPGKGILGSLTIGLTIGKTIGKWWFYDVLWDFVGIYPLVMTLTVCELEHLGHGNS